MSKLSQFEKDECLKITERLLSWPICSPFVLMDNPEMVDSQNYLQKVKERPSSLFDVKIDLTTNKYRTVKDWENEVNSILSKAKSYYGRGTLYYTMATEASSWFQEKMENFPKEPEKTTNQINYYKVFYYL